MPPQKPFSVPDALQHLAAARHALGNLRHACGAGPTPDALHFALADLRAQLRTLKTAPVSSEVRFLMHDCRQHLARLGLSPTTSGVASCMTELRLRFSEFQTSLGL